MKSNQKSILILMKELKDGGQDEKKDNNSRPRTRG